MTEITCSPEDILREARKELEDLKERCINRQGSVDTYKKMAVLNFAIDAITRNVPRPAKVYIREPFAQEEAGRCPKCACKIQAKIYEKPKITYCPKCGQAISWEDGNEANN